VADSRSPDVRYRIAAQDLAGHRLEVSCTVARPAAAGQVFRLPAWTPGSYLIREFARHVLTVRAYSRGVPVSIHKVAKDRWQAAPCDGPLTVIAEIYAYDLSVRTAYVDQTRAYFNGASVFLSPEGLEASACQVEIAPVPERPQWRVATTLPRDGAAPWGFGAYRASDYDELIDHPVEMAAFDHVAFTAGGATHDIVVTGQHRGDLQRLADDVQRICQWQIDLFGGASGSTAPFSRYLFQVMAVGDGHGGLEHRTSTSLLCARHELPRHGETRVGDDYRKLLGLFSHEYFHAWNVKRIKPAAFAPYDLFAENYTRELWAFEGFTSYYDDLALARSRVIDAASYLELLGRTITSVLRVPGRRLQSVADASFDAWIKHYRPDENSPNAGISYYTKGAMVALALDLMLRRAGRSLDDLIRLLWQRYGQDGAGVPEGSIRALAVELGGAACGAFFDRCVEGTEDPPFADLLGGFAVNFRTRPADGPRDRGGAPGKRSAEGPARSTLGVKVAGSAEARLQHVFSDGPAARAGLAAGDVVIAVDGLRVTADGFDSLADRHAPGESVVVHAFRRDELMRFEVVLDSAASDTCFLVTDDGAPTEAVARRKAWLGN